MSASYEATKLAPFTKADLEDAKATAAFDQSALVSVVIPMYNCARDLRQCLDSLRAQTYASFEVLCVDDGSTDDTADIVRAYCEADCRFMLLSQENAGPGVARNRAIDAAHGDYLYCLDADDWIAPRTFEWAVARAHETEADIVMFSVIEYNDATGLYRTAPWLVRGDLYPKDVFSWHDNPDWIFRAFQNYPWDRFLRMDFVREENLRFQEIYLTEDLMFSAPGLVLAKRITLLHESPVYHRVGTTTNAMSQKDAHPFDFYESFLALKRWLEGRGLYEDLKVAYVNWALNAVVYNLVTLKSPEGFKLVFDRVKGEIIDRLDIHAIPREAYQDEYEVRMLDAIERMDAAGFGMYLIQDLRADCLRLQFVDSDMHALENDLRGEMAHKDEEIGRLRGELEGERGQDAAERDRLHGELDAARAEAEALRKSTSFRLGNALVRPFAALKRRARR